MTAAVAHLAPIIEISRRETPCASPMALVYQHDHLWIGSAQDNTFYQVRISDNIVTARCAAPSKPFGATRMGDEIHVICADQEDNRSIHTMLTGPAPAFTPASVRCPNDTGNFLAYDGAALYVSQRYDKLLVRIDASGAPTTTWAMPREVIGITAVGDVFYALSTDGPNDEDVRLARVSLRLGLVEVADVARVPFAARSLAHDGTRFWTNWRAANALIAFDLPA
jgi:hypothetical protein